ncbi:hypothetical protein [Aquimarina longa]|uniref:hypothetical protein n=1 Tax=Aquimarina longa TaxID=1080221 RepID=UPI00078494F2|nr:hypothetical protein [Aquimarina longa]
MKKILLLICLVASSTLFAQLPRDLLTPIPKTYLYEDYNGSIYLNNRYKEASVIDERSGTFDAKLKYNIHSDALEYNSGSELYEVNKNPTVHVRIDGNYFYYCDFENQRGSSRTGYYILVELNDRYRIYKKVTLKIKEPQKSVAQIGPPPEPGSIKAITTYYLEESGVIMELPMNKKEMLAAFSDKENELKEYLKKEKIRFKKEEDLIRLVARYNALKSSDSSPSRSLLSNRGQNN